MVFKLKGEKSRANLATQGSSDELASDCPGWLQATLLWLRLLEPWVQGHPLETHVPSAYLNCCATHSPVSQLEALKMQLFSKIFLSVSSLYEASRTSRTAVGMGCQGMA